MSLTIQQTIKRGDTGQRFGSQLMVKSGDTYLPFDLTGKSVKFLMKSQTGNIAIAQPAAIIGDPANGSVEYAPQSSDVSTSGVYNVEWEVTDQATSEKLTFPGDHYEVLKILDDLG
jgi:hypothetical protein